MTDLKWKVNTGALLKEILENDSTQVLERPIQIFADLLAQVGERAAQLNDPALNALMCRLAIYSLSDPYSPDYDKELTDIVIALGETPIETP